MYTDSVCLRQLLRNDGHLSGASDISDCQGQFGCLAGLRSLSLSLSWREWPFQIAEEYSSVTIILIDGGPLNRTVVRMEYDRVYKRALFPVRGHMDAYVYPCRNLLEFCVP